MTTTRTTTVLALLGLLAFSCTVDDADGTTAADGDVTIRAVAPGPFEDVPSSVPAGEVTLQLINDDEMGHSLRIEELDTGVDLVAAGSEGSATVTFEAGETYTFYCDVPGHRDLGMEGTFTAEG